MTEKSTQRKRNNRERKHKIQRPTKEKKEPVPCFRSFLFFLFGLWFLFSSPTGPVLFFFLFLFHSSFLFFPFLEIWLFLFIFFYLLCSLLFFSFLLFVLSLLIMVFLFFCLTWQCFSSRSCNKEIKDNSQSHLFQEENWEPLFFPVFFSLYFAVLRPSEDRRFLRAFSDFFLSGSDSSGEGPKLWLDNSKKIRFRHCMWIKIFTVNFSAYHS